MGQDLLLLNLDWKKKGKESPEKGFRRMLDAIDKRIDKIKRQISDDRVSDINPDWGVTSDGSGVCDFEGKDVTLDMYKQHLYDLVDQLRESWDGRDTVCFLVGGEYWVFVTGGGSWGDSPSETYDVLSKLYSAGVV